MTIRPSVSVSYARNGSLDQGERTWDAADAGAGL